MTAAALPPETRAVHCVIRVAAVLLMFLQPCFFCGYFSQRYLLLSLKMAPRSSVDLVSCTHGVWQSHSIPVFEKTTEATFPLPEKYDALRLDFGSRRDTAVELREIKLRHWFYEYTLPMEQFYQVFAAPNQITHFELNDSTVAFQTGGNDGFFVIENLDYFEKSVTPKLLWNGIILYYAILATLLLIFAFSQKIAAGVAALARNYSCETKILAHQADGLDQLTSLRFFAAMMIVVAHSLGHMGIPRLSPGGLTNGVSFFYVLSGFILAYAYRDLSTPKQILTFYKNRIGRIWPLHVLLLILTTIFLFDNLRMRGNFQNGWLLVTNLFLVQSWIPITEYNFAYNAVAWSISTELFFYLCFPLILKFKKTFTVLALSVLAGSLVISNAGLIPHASGDAVSAMALLYVWPGVRILEFICGMWVCDWFFKRKLKLGFLAGTGLEVLTLTVTVLYLCYLPEICSYLEPIWGVGSDQYFSHCGAILIVPLLIYVFACHSGAISRILQKTPFVLAGEISFSIYLLHQPVIFYVQEHLAWFAGWSAWQIVAVTYAFIMVAAFLLWKFFETPTRKYVKKIQL